MLGRNRARGLWLTLSAKDRGRSLGNSAVCCGLSLVLAASLTQCGFPEYGFRSLGPELGGSAGSSGGSSGDAGTPDIAGGAGTSRAGEGGGLGASASAGAGGGAGAGAGAGGEAGEAGAGGDAGCVYPAPVLLPQHCSDNQLSPGETGVDCGGDECPSCTHQEACVQNRDCASARCSAAKTCAPALSLRYASMDYAKTTRAPKFKLVISYLGWESIKLSELRIRYYFDHNGVTEPVIGLDSQATVDPGESLRDISSSVSALVYRQLPGGVDAGGRHTDSYLEITFKDDHTLLVNGTELVVVQDIVAGSAEGMFEQKSHYSFMDTHSLTTPGAVNTVENNAITVFRGEQRLWGVEPPLRPIPPCAFVGGVNIGGDALRIHDEAISAEQDEPLTFSHGQSSTNSAAKALPATDELTTQLLSTWHTLSSADTALWSVPNGKYWVYAWLTSAGGTASGTLSLQHSPADKFYDFHKDSAGAWGLIGPYAVDVIDETLTLSVQGTVNLAGLKLYRAPASSF